MWTVPWNAWCASRFGLRFRCLLLPLGIVLPFWSSSADDWPLGYVLDESSRSPDGHYGIIIPRHDPQYDDKTYIALPDDIQIANYFDDLRTKSASRQDPIRLH